MWENLASACWTRGVPARESSASAYRLEDGTSTGYTSQLQPSQDCSSVYMIVIVQVITASLIDYCMMGLVFARFASPDKRSFTIRFSSNAVLYQRPEDGLWCLSFRLANIRKHSLISPQISLMLALPAEGRGPLPRLSESGSGGAAAAASTGGLTHFRFQELPIEDLPTQFANLRLGLHAHINHAIRPGSPLYDMSLETLEALGAEVLCFMEGIDPTTSNNIQARHSYTPHDIRMNERFVPIELKLRRGELGLDFSGFDVTTAKALADTGAAELREGGVATFLMPVPGPSLGPSPPASARPSDVEAGWAANGAHTTGAQPDPLGALQGAGGRGLSGTGRHPAQAREMDTVMAAALSGDMQSHMRALRSQSIRSLTAPLLTMPQLVPSVAAGGGGGTPFGVAAATAASTGGGQCHPLAGAASFGHGGGRGPAGASALGPPALPPVVPASGGGGGLALSPGAVLDLLDAVLTDAGCAADVKRQAAALKEAVTAYEHMPRGPAELAGRQL
ncbi:hypothetical protein GPECTOR_3g443 [Gonium pectorale]|uniref:Inward rectifier potassium channel C-terminal domain-containing protein n=1 Tax=Gonium pectorale TaxID=33097 RepID=A0A150GZM0_GONPE|nr:hypothetical protein GPECTOR_3g443 [Gonium pectorale]|eukprot:KXZ55309.1 hypothetical protein GPECTOR_3g443 [Gonium pectorale]